MDPTGPNWWQLDFQLQLHVIGSTAPRAGPFGVQGHHAVTLRRRDGAVALRWRHGALTATRRHSASMLRHRRGTLVLRQPHGATLPHRRRAAAAWCWYATTPTPYGHAMTATRRHAATPTPRHSSLALRLGATLRHRRRAAATQRCNTLRRRMVMLRQQLGAEPLRRRRRAAATRRRHANSDAAWSRCDSNTPPATSANDSDAALQQYGAATEID
ncbi:hypothetical protein EDB89DRAFT_1906342 [Lactarius sanguifluus]|nr:hypothetical protein EDB89DRAFT_1906342 [Lactarius sanguifluus]